ncbi:7-carboxy-7-deazaguanine synthase QueE [Campylobacter hyointestinalis]|uniref:7-carboxy-7-deazaguanine synthase QueE n=1 Tax=Campylobacter hyointestinalis TaxID=198 RepID=UPI0011AC2E9E|nr:7-carboxy-7-deazaguanine synthase QueE [Campylobacter hyointestinalis]TWO31305.1 7-carboxy-7-deazaguanine synthase QueE [Campylobacter hyointestinalis]
MVSVVEHFISIQGEGKFSGRYSLFIRLGGCNLSCKGFGVKTRSLKTGEILVGCDTIKAVQTSHFKHSKFDYKALVNLVKETEFKPLIVITGGEPLLWHKDEDLIKFAQWCFEQDYEVHFETNGTIFVDFDKFEVYKKSKFAVSVKLSISSEPKSKRINQKALQAIFANADAFYKFVICGSELDEINEILELQNGEVWCMPLGKDRFELGKNALNVAEFCIKNGFNYSDRLHVRLWNDKEGV